MDVVQFNEWQLPEVPIQQHIANVTTDNDIANSRFVGYVTEVAGTSYTSQLHGDVVFPVGHRGPPADTAPALTSQYFMLQADDSNSCSGAPPAHAEMLVGAPAQYYSHDYESLQQHQHQQHFVLHHRQLEQQQSLHQHHLQPAQERHRQVNDSQQTLVQHIPELPGNRDTVDVIATKKRSRASRATIAKLVKPPRERKVWSKVIKKQLYQSGLGYVDGKGKNRPQRSVKPACLDTCKYHCHQKISQEQRQILFEKFWLLPKDEKCNYIAITTAHIGHIKKRRKDTKNRRQHSYKYFLTSSKGGISARVCKKFYLSTLDISAGRIYSVHKKEKTSAGIPISPDNRGKTNPRIIPEADKLFARVHIETFPKVPPSVKIATNSQSYLPNMGVLTVSRMYALYKEKCAVFDLQPIKESMYRMVAKLPTEEREAVRTRPPTISAALVAAVKPKVKPLSQSRAHSTSARHIPDVEKKLEVACRVRFPMIPPQYIRHIKPRPKQEASLSKRDLTTELCQAGKEHLSRKGRYQPQRQVKPGCVSTCRYQCSANISELQRHMLFNEFWSLSKNEKFRFIALTTVNEGRVKKSRKNDIVKKRTVYKHFLTVDEESQAVCKKFYLATLDISAERVYHVHSRAKSRTGTPIAPDNRGKSNPRKVTDTDREFARTHIASFPPIPTQCVKITEKNREFLESIGVVSVCRMYTLYREKCLMERRLLIKERLYRNLRNEYLIKELLSDEEVPT